MNSAANKRASDTAQNSTSLLVRLFAYSFVRVGWVLMRIMFRVRIRGMELMPRSGPVLLISNHPTYLDPVLLVGLTQLFLKRSCLFMAWDKLFLLPMVGAVMRAFGAFPVDLDKPGRKPYENMLRQLRSGGMAGIFPEGSRSEGELMGPWKPGALRAALSSDPDIVPVTVVGADKAWPRDSIIPRFFQRVTIHIHPPRKLEEIGDKRNAGSASAKDWLKGLEDILRDEINEPIRQAGRERSARRLKHYQNATPRHLQWKGVTALTK